MLGAAGFSIHCYSTKSFRTSLMVGRFLSIISCLLYGLIEIYPENVRRWPWLGSFLLQATAEGSNIVLRSFIARVSTGPDRQTAYAMLSAGEMLAIVSGPLIQFICGKYMKDVVVTIASW
ncbi:hypothetical protein PFISCL1PPCAC_4669, partial [Pristionchus fissidentatus]